MDIKLFLDTSYTAFHAVENGVKYLKSNGFEELPAFTFDGVKKGGKYFFTFNGTSLFAFKVGDEKKFNIAESHTDSPSLKIKGRKTVPSVEGKRLNVEKYGGLVLFSLVNSPLKIAGRLIEKAPDGVKAFNVVSPFFVNIPALCIHHNPEVNSSLSLSVQSDMLPLVGETDDIYSVLSDKEVIDGDLYVVPATEAFVSGVQNEYLCSPRIDNLTSVYASLKALVECNPKGISVAACFDNEEVGSRTKQGADSDYLKTSLTGIIRALGGNDEDFVKATQNGFILSVDNAHAAHPAHLEKSDPYEKAAMNKGIVIKRHTNYATDGYSSAVLKTILDKAGVEYQEYYNNSDVRCGGTIGLMTGAALNMKACDIGLAQLAMHSGIETVGNSDIEKMQKCIKSFFDASLSVDGEQTIIG